MSTSTRSALPALLTVLCLAAPLFAQSVSKEPVVKSLRGSISGRVTIKEKPARGVTIGLRKSGLMSASDSFTKAVTDADGLYRLTDVPAGSYLVTIAAPAFINPEVTGFKTVVLSEGENVEDIDFTLVRGGVITGRVTDAEGRPVVLQNVFIIPADGIDAPRPPQAPTTGLTDDRGIYRVFGIKPGRYKAAAGHADNTASAGWGQSPYKRVFHPDVSDAARATVIEIGEGTEATKVDIALGGVAQTYSVSGRVVNGESGAPVPNLNFVLRPVAGQGLAYCRVDARGEFVSEGVAPGKYTVMVMDESNRGLRADKVTVEVIDRDLTDVTIKLATGVTVSGVVVLETDDKVARSRLFEMVVQGSVRAPQGARYGSSATERVAADGSFILKGLANGTLELALSSVNDAYPPKGFSITRIERDGIVGPRLELNEGQNVTGVKIFVGYGTASIRGVVNLQNGPLPSGARIFVQLSRPGETSFIRNVPADERGRFVVDGIAAGLYEITAVVSGVEKRRKQVKQQISLSDGLTTEVNLTIDLAAFDTP
jgi:hypothetical protein